MINAEYHEFFSQNSLPRGNDMTDKHLLKMSKVRSKSISYEDIHNTLDDQTEGKKAKKKTIKLSWVGICIGASPENLGHWIKSDSDCK